MLDLIKMKIQSNEANKVIESNQKRKDRSIKQQNANTSTNRLELDKTKFADKKVNQKTAKEEYNLSTDPTESTRTKIGNYEFEQSLKKKEPLTDKQDRYITKLNDLEKQRKTLEEDVEVVSKDEDGNEIITKRKNV